MAVSFIDGGNRSTRRKPPTCHKSQTNLYRVHLVWTRFELTTLVVIGTDYIGSYKSNYHTITTMAAPMPMCECKINHNAIKKTKKNSKLYSTFLNKCFKHEHHVARYSYILSWLEITYICTMYMYDYNWSLIRCSNNIKV